MIIAAIPYCPEHEGRKPEPGLDLGYAINELMERLRDDDWALILDHDLMITTRTWYRQLERAIREKPDAGFFTCLRWPAVNTWSTPGGVERTFDVRYHRQFGKTLAKANEGELVDVTDWTKLKPPEPTSGIFLVPKKVWREVGGFKNGFKQIDHNFHKRVADAGYRVYLMRDVYMYHMKGL